MPNLKDISETEKRALLKKILQEKVANQPKPVITESPLPPLIAEDAPIPPEYYQFESFPEIVQLQALFEQLKKTGQRNPYFQPHTGVNNNKTEIAGQSLLNFSSFNYVGMSGDPAVSLAVIEAVMQYGSSVSASRPVSGETPLHVELERQIAEFIGVEACLVYVSGHATNVTTISHLFGPGDLILHDVLVHNSSLQGAQFSGARRIPFPHNDHQAVERILREQRRHYKRVLILTEGVYSMDGDLPPLPQLIEIKNRHKALLMVDEAHSIGILGNSGRGVCEHFGVDPNQVDLCMGTLSKALASCGGYIAGSKTLINYLKNTAPGFIFSVGITPANAAAALASLQLIKSEPVRLTQLHERSKMFLAACQSAGLNTGLSKDTPVVSIIVGDSSPCFQLSNALFQRGINVHPMVYPSVEEGDARLRFFISATHTERQLQFTVDVLVEEMAKLAL